MKIGFDNDKYMHIQSERILERIGQFGGKLYLELGGKLFDDFHASRVLPGFHPDSKIQMLMRMKDQEELIVVINSADIEKNKVRGDLGITYDADVLRLIDAFREIGMYVGSVVLTQYQDQSAAASFMERLTGLGIRVYRHYPIAGYPSDVDTVVSPEGYGRNEYIETTRPLVLVTAPGPGSGKMATCLSQLYHEHLRGVNAGYAKFETFPVWDLPISHPVNIAYEAATADLGDVNMIDPFHLDAYGKTAVNYNRDVEIFPVLKSLFEHIYGSSPYQSPTDMGVNMISQCIVDDEECRSASRREILRRLYAAKCSQRKGHSDGSDVTKIQLLMQKLQITDAERPCIEAARKRAALTDAPALAVELPDGSVITGKTSNLLGPSAALLLNALKALAGIKKCTHLISPTVIGPMQQLKLQYLGNHNPRLHSDEVLVALSICAASDPQARAAMEALPRLKGCEVHSTVILPQTDDNIFRRLELNLTCDSQYQTKKLYHK